MTNKGSKIFSVVCVGVVLLTIALIAAAGGLS
jgi:hypothetical protein